MPKPLSCIIIDDEELAIQLLKAYVGKIPFLRLEAGFTNALDAVALLSGRHIDLVITDVQMPHLNGLQFGQAVAGKTKIIFISSFRDFAVNGFELNAVDYLLKPISFDRFLQAAQKALGLPSAPVPGQHQPPPAAAQGFLFVKTGGRLVRIDTADILYVEARKEYACIVKEGGEKVMALQSMLQMEEQLGRTKFIRIHKSYIAALGRIDAIERSRAVIGGQYIPIGDSYRETLFKAIAPADGTLY